MNAKSTISKTGCVHFIGSGPGDPELLTLKAQRLIAAADLILYAGSLVNPQVLRHARPNTPRHNTADLCLEEQIALMRTATERGGSVARLHTGDPAIFGAIYEQMRALDGVGIAYDVVPGVSSALAAAAALTIELTIPELTQTVVFSRVSGRTPVPPRESLSHLAALRCSLVLFLSVGMLSRVTAELAAAGYEDETPIAVVYRVSWPDQRIVRGTLRDIAQRVEQAEITRQALIIVSPALRSDLQETAAVSHLYGTAMDQPMRRDRPAIITLTRLGTETGLRLHAEMPDAHLYVPRRFLPESVDTIDDGVFPFDISIRQVLQSAFQEHGALICIMASGIVVREIAPLLRNKHSDPAVVVADARGEYAVSLLSGHKGGANRLAHRVAAILGGQAVITTASDVQGLPALDLIGRQEGWVLEAQRDLTAVTAALVNSEPVGVWQESGDESWWPDPAPHHLQRHASCALLAAAAPVAALLITHHRVAADVQATFRHAVIYHPRVLAIGVGCNRGTPADEIEAAIADTLASANLAPQSVACLATVEAKADEVGLLTLCTRRDWPLRTYSVAELNRVENLPNPSIWAERALGARGVAEPAAALAARADQWLVEKKKYANVTVALCLVQHDKPATHGEDAHERID